MKNLFKLKILIALLFIISGANAQYVGTGSKSDTITVSEIKENAWHLSWSDQIINLKGFVVEQYKEDYYWFEDNTGRIKVEIEPNFMPHVPFNRNTEVLISGEVCYPLIGRTYIGAKKIELTGKQR
jgi:uncharacterized protein (TIGR00156 family)